MATDIWVTKTICDWIWEKGPLRAEDEYLIVHDVKAVIATGLKPDIAIVQSLNYTRCNFCTLPTSGLGVAIVSVPHGQKLAVFKPHHFS